MLIIYNHKLQIVVDAEYYLFTECMFIFLCYVCLGIITHLFMAALSVAFEEETPAVVPTRRGSDSSSSFASSG